MAGACSSYVEVEDHLGHQRRHWCTEIGAHDVHEADVVFTFGVEEAPLSEMVLDERRTIRWSA